MRKSSPADVHKFFITASVRPLRWTAPILLALAFFVPSWSAAARDAVSAPATAPAADFTLPTAGGEVALRTLRGKVVLVDFWASWCAPCRQSFPWLNTIAARYAASDFVVVAIDLDKSREPAEKFLREFAPGFTVAFDPAGRSAEAYEVAAMPSSFLVGRDGQLLFAHAGFDPRDASAIESRIQEAIAR